MAQSRNERFDRLHVKSPVSDGCWEWAASGNGSGYGKFWNGTRLVYAHRFAYERWVGPIPDGRVIDHLCRNPGCVNPDHLEAVTVDENTRRGVSPGARAGRSGLCKNGHALEGENLYVRSDGRGRECRACRSEARKAHYRRTGS